MHTYVAYVCSGVKGHTGLADYGYAAYDCATTPRTGVDACRGREEKRDRLAQRSPVAPGGVVVMTEKAWSVRDVRLAIGSRASLVDAFDTVAVARSIEPTVPLTGRALRLRPSRVAAYMPREYAAGGGTSGPGPDRPVPAAAAPITF